MALAWKTENGKEVGYVDGASNPAFILEGKVLEVRVTGAEQFSGEKAGTTAEIKTYCGELLTDFNVPLNGTVTQG